MKYMYQTTRLMSIIQRSTPVRIIERYGSPTAMVYIHVPNDTESSSSLDTDSLTPSNKASTYRTATVQQPFFTASSQCKSMYPAARLANVYIRCDLELSVLILPVQIHLFSLDVQMFLEHVFSLPPTTTQYTSRDKTSRIFNTIILRFVSTPLPSYVELLSSRLS